MFDIGFWELCMIAVVSLVILGPERLPIAARTAGKWLGRIRSTINSVKQDIDRELRLDEIRTQMREQEEKLRDQSGLNNIQDALDLTIADLDKDIDKDKDKTADTPEVQESKTSDTTTEATQNSSQAQPDPESQPEEKSK